MSDLIIKMFYV